MTGEVALEAQELAVDFAGAVRQATELIYLGQAAITRASNDLLSEQGLGRAHYRALYVVARVPGLTVGRLTALLRVTPQAIGRVMNDLLKKNLIVQKISNADRRARCIYLTPAGAELEVKVYSAQADILDRVFRRLGRANVDGLLNTLSALVEEADPGAPPIGRVDGNS